MCNTVLVVDDMEINRELLAEILKDKYDVMMAENGKQALEYMEKRHQEIAVILLDLIMPQMDGFEVLKAMRENLWLDKIPVLVISGESSVKVEQECFEYGVSDFIHKPFDNALVKKRVDNIVSLFQYQRKLEDKVADQTKTLREQYKVLEMQAERLRQSNNNIIDVLGTVVEHRNLESGEHVKRVKGYTRIMAEEIRKAYPEYGLTKEKIEVIVSASALHDLGKIAIPDSILLKPGKFTKEEFDCMKAHTLRGCEILSSIEGVWDEEYGKIGYEICRYHHERYDGKGYPDGLKEDEIPISAQLVSVADVYDALVNERVYKDAIPKDKAFQMIIDGECGTFSPKLMECFRRARDKFENLADNKPGNNKEK
ncbi:MAG TPA: two-component system response regulator [Lachnospiraceae bacterium]|nr:two-component system response regulator [Lachnospiraceae bacterium]